LELVLSPRARQDLVEILRYTAEHWGESQIEVYGRRLDDAIQRISRNPEIGALRHDLDEPYRTVPVGVHVIVYRQNPDRIRILRVLHQRMDPANRY
jgi:toxin ParE1/3/4